MRNLLIFSILVFLIGIYVFKPKSMPTPSGDTASPSASNEDTSSTAQLDSQASPGATAAKQSFAAKDLNEGAETFHPRATSENEETDRKHAAGDGNSPASRSPSPSSRPSLPGPIKTADASGPSIGNVKVLGHRGCDLNTPGWFLSTGTPEQYDFTIIDDGETVEVTPSVANPTGNFEFVHCADVSELIGQKVRMTARVKTEQVTQTAQLRLRGEDEHRKVVVGATTPVGGTHDWQDFTVDAEIAPDTYQFSYGMTFKSTGKLWINHPTFGPVKN